MKIKGLLLRGDEEEEEEPSNYFMEALTIPDHELGQEQKRSQAFRAKIVAFFSRPKISFAMDVIATFFNMSIIVIYIIYLDSVHDFIADIDNNQYARFYIYFLKAGHIFFLVDFLLRFATSKNPGKFLL